MAAEKENRTPEEKQQKEAATVDGFISNVADYVDLTSELISELEDKNASLIRERDEARAQTGSEEGVEKTAAVLSEEKLDETLELMTEAGFLKKAQVQDAKAKVQESPEMLLVFLDKIAERKTRSVPKLGQMTDGGDSREKVAGQNVTHKESDEYYENSVKRLRSRL